MVDQWFPLRVWELSPGRIEFDGDRVTLFELARVDSSRDINTELSRDSRPVMTVEDKPRTVDHDGTDDAPAFYRGLQRLTLGLSERWHGRRRRV